ncbi:MAG: biopolymer transporter ExbD [bacterium]|nr:biopolymer transporter ExbD [bacterium]
MANEKISAASRAIVRRRLAIGRRKREAFVRLTSLIDVFTILLCFLIKNFSATPEVTLIAKNLQLPISTATQAPEISTTVSATRQAVLLNGEFVDTIENFRLQKEMLHTKLYEKLIRTKERFLLIAQKNPDRLKFQGKIIIQADKKIPYQIIKKLIYTCGQAEFGKISLHVLQKEI